MGCHVAREAREGQSESVQIAIRGPSDTLHKSRDMTSWSCGGDLERNWHVGVVTCDERDRSGGSRDVT